eukprot:6513503-Alexandrium_andersonii.AAC.1
MAKHLETLMEDGYEVPSGIYRLYITKMGEHVCASGNVEEFVHMVLPFPTEAALPSPSEAFDLKKPRLAH